MADPQMRIRLILWAAMTASIIVFAAVIPLLPPAPEPPDAKVLPIAFFVVSVVVAALSFILPAILLRNALRSTKIEVREEPDPSQVSYRDKVPMRRMFADPESARKAALLLTFTPFILSMALSESIAMFGFVLVATGHSVMTAAAFFVGGFVLMVARFPRLTAILASLEKACSARFT